MQYIVRHDVKPHMANAYRTWLVENEEAIRANAPDGWTYLGTWATVQGFGRFQAETRWELEGYASLGASFGSEEYQKLLLAWFDFVDEVRPGETALMKSMHDVAIMENS